MDHELELTRASRLDIARAFRFNKRVDLSIECAIEGQHGKVFVDDVDQPTVYGLTVGPFWYFAGDGRSPGGRQLLQRLPPYGLLMPSPAEWVESARESHGEDLHTFPRYRMSNAQLSAEHLTHLLEGPPLSAHLVPLGPEIIQQLLRQPDAYFDLSDFESPADFIRRGIGYALVRSQTVMGVAYSSLVCSHGIEVSIYVEERYRRQGVATVLGSQLVLTGLERGLRPNWDAANPESVKLAEKLGFTLIETYNAYYHTGAARGDQA